MKRSILTIAFCFIAVLGLQAQKGGKKKEVNGGPKISFNKKVHDYGTVPKGGDGTCTFTVTNKGSEPLVINNCRGSCGCTVPTCPKKPIAPGESTKIKVKYNTNRVGRINKSVSVKSNAVNKPNATLRIKGKVSPKKTTPKKKTPKDAPVDK